MADNVTVNPSTGVSEATVVAFDDCGAAGKAQIVKLAVSADGSAIVLPADATNGLDVDVTRAVLPTGASTEATTAAVLAKLSADPATQTTLAAILAKLIAAPATEATLAAVLAKLIVSPATEATVAALLPGVSPLTMGAPARVPAATSSTSLAAANASRRGLYLFNESTAALRIKFATGASATSYTTLIPANGFLSFDPPLSQQIVHGIWDAATGAVMVTEAT